MVFEQAPLTENFDMVRYVSKGGVWEVGLKQMLFGVRVRLGRVGDMGADLDYCAGADPEMQQTLLRTVMLIVLPVPETASVEELTAPFPRCRRKPVFLDPCWPMLQDLAYKALEQVGARK